MPDDRPYSAPLAAIAAIAALAALLTLGRHHERARALRAESMGAVPDAGIVAPPPTPDELLAPIDVNHAPASELVRLPRIGPALAARIIEHRPFERIDDLSRVPGIGPRTIERLRDHVVCGP